MVLEFTCTIGSPGFQAFGLQIWRLLSLHNHKSQIIIGIIFNFCAEFWPTEKRVKSIQRCFVCLTNAMKTWGVVSESPEGTSKSITKLTVQETKENLVNTLALNSRLRSAPQVIKLPLLDCKCMSPKLVIEGIQHSYDIVSAPLGIYLREMTTRVHTII